MSKIIRLKYYGPEPDCNYDLECETEEDVFLHLAECAKEWFNDGEMDFDNIIVQNLVDALKSCSYKKLMECLNAFIYPMNCDYYEVEYGPLEKSEPGKFNERMAKVFSSVEKAREKWKEWKNE